MKRNKDAIVRKNFLIIIGLFIISISTYIWTLNLPIIGDGLMHLNDSTDIGSIKNIIKSFYTFDGIGKPENTTTLVFHRPIFNEIIVEVIKQITSYNTYSIRMISILIHAVTVIIVYLIGWEIFNSYYKASILGLFINFALTYFHGIYEFGLSFSLWLTLFSTISFYYTIKYSEDNKNIYLFLALIFTFITIYIKESALTIGIALSWYILGNDIYKNKRVTKISVIFGVFQIIILGIYLISRYNKLGNLFVVAGGIDVGERITFKLVLEKIIGYFYYSFNIPNKFLPAYMCININYKLVGISFFMLLIPIYILYRVIFMIKIKDKRGLDSLLYLGMFLILIIPVCKTTRNAPYYGDIFVLFVLLTILTVFNLGKKQNYMFLMIFLSIYILIFGVNIYDSIKKDSSYYLSMTSNESMLLKNKLNYIKDDIGSEKVLLSSNWIRNGDYYFIYNHNGMGSFYKYNIDFNKEVDIAQSNNINNNVTIVDYFKEVEDNDLQIFIFPEKQNSTKLVQIEYEVDKNNNIGVGFFYNNKYYYSSIDVAFKKSWSDDNKLFFVIPEESNMDIVGVNCTIEYLNYN